MWIDPQTERVFFTHSELRSAFAALPADLTDEAIAAVGLLAVQRVAPPQHHALTQQATPLPPALVDGVWVEQWAVDDLPPEQQQAALANVQNQIVARVQQRLDAFVATRGYDSILSACTYATSPVPRFAAEGQCAVNSRDATWATLYTILAEVQAGTRPVPMGIEDIADDLPPLTWPE